MRNSGRHTFTVQTKNGLLRVVVEKSASTHLIEFYLPVPRFNVLRSIPPALMRSLGITRSDLDPSLPAVRANYFYLPVRKRSRLWELRPDMKGVAEACRRLKTLGVCLVTLQTVEESSAFHSRFFIPAAGIDEDPVTGSANGPLGVYCFKYGIRKGIALPSYWLLDDRLEFIGEQGDCMGRKGRVKVRLKVKKGVVSDVCIAGEAVTLFKAGLHVDP
jgi:PhzF family phenazine biosynthesis protein